MYIYICIHSFKYIYKSLSDLFWILGGSIWYFPNITCHKDLKKHQETFGSNMPRSPKQHSVKCTGTSTPPPPFPTLFPYPAEGEGAIWVSGRLLSSPKPSKTNISPETCCLEDKPFLLKWCRFQVTFTNFSQYFPQSYHTFCIVKSQMDTIEWPPFQGGYI